MGFGTDFDDDGDVLPDAPRETEQKDPLYQSIDIQVSDTTQSSPAKNRLLMALPRKYFPNNSSTDPDGTSFFYPGVSDLLYDITNDQAAVVLLFFTLYKDIGDARKMVFPTDTHNSIKGVNSIIFNDSANLSSNTEVGPEFYMNADLNTVENAAGDRVIANVGIIDFDRDYQPKGCLGATTFGTSGYGATTGTSTSAQYINAIGPMIRNVGTIYVGTSWGENNNGVDGGFGLDAILSGSPYRNTKGTTIGNGDSGSTTPTWLQNQYNRKGGIYIKQQNGAHGIHCIHYDGESRWAMGMGRYGNLGTEHLYFHYAAHENEEPKSQGFVKSDKHSTTSAGTQMNFTGQHRCEDKDDSLQNVDIGLIVVSTGKYNNLLEAQKPTINESLPVVALSTKRNQKSVFGVLSNKEDRNGGPREYSFGNFVSVHHDDEELDRLIINSLGEGGVWICNINGNLENGDYITTCEIPGYGMLQDDDLLHNYTVAKITQDCNFELDNPYYDCVEFEFEGQTYRKAFVGCTYHCG